MEDDDKDKKEIVIDIKKTTISLSVSETVFRFGSANAEFIKGYAGIDRITGQIFNKSLKGIAAGKVHPDYLDQNLKQQAGYAAEVVATSRDNANAIIDNSSVRSLRSDDTVEYGRNHTIVDRVKVQDRKSTRLNSSHVKISYAVFCLKKKIIIVIISTRTAV